VIGKWGLGPPGTEGAPLAQGFDHSFGYNCQRNAHFFYREFLFRDDERVEIDPKQWTHELLTQDALAWLGARDASTPFFLYLPYTIPHASIEAPQELIDPFIGKWGEEKPYQGGHYSAQPTPRAAFAAMVTQLDADVGKLIDLLREKGLAENTLVIFTSDNGPHQEGGADPEFFDSSGPFRGIKRDLYEGGIRVPHIAWWPGTVQPGVSDHASAMWDFLPTATELAGLPLPTGLDGISYAPTLLGTSKQAAHDFLYWEFHERGAAQAVRAGNWKAVRTKLAANPDAPVELYDLDADPGESTDLAAEHPQVAARLLQTMKEQHVAAPSWRFPTDPESKK
jgi:arylsulfatase A